MQQLPTTWEQICEAQGIDPNFTPSLDGIEERFKPAMIADWKIMNIAEVLNGKDYEAEYDEISECKYWPYFYFDASAGRFRFSDTDNGSTSASAGTGARRVFKTSALARHAGQHFEDIYNECLMAKKV